MRKIFGFVYLSITMILFVLVVSPNTISRIFAHSEDNSPTGESGEYSEIWEATEVTGDAHGYDALIGDNRASTFERVKEVSSRNQLSTPNTDMITHDSWYIKGAIEELIRWGIANRSGGTCNFSYTTDPSTNIPMLRWGTCGGTSNGHLISNSSSKVRVTGWKVNGHMHP